MSTPSAQSTSKPHLLFSSLSISRKLLAIVVLCVVFSFAALIIFGITRTQSDMEHVTYRDNQQMTELLTATVTPGVRWRQPLTIENAYRAFLRRPDSGLASIVTLDIDGNILTTDDSEFVPAIDLHPTIEKARDTIARNETFTVRDSESIIFVAPVLNGGGNVRVGTIAVGWSLDELNALLSSNLNRQEIFAGFSLLTLIIVLVVLLNYTVTHPLRAVSRATMLIAQCEDSVCVPETHRGDEIGEMARSLEVFKHHIAMLDEMSEAEHEHHRQLSEALENERKYNALHREFVSMASHEFRTPLAIIDGAAQRITRRADRMGPDELLERVGKIRHAVTRMIGLIDSTLSASRMEAGRTELALQTCNLHDIVETVCRRQQEIAQEHDIALDLRRAPIEIAADPEQLDQIFTNLLSNAVKYSPNKSRIEVIARADGGMTEISVRDHGVGIREDELPKLFERFFRATTSTGIPGTGIGLNLVKQLVEMHGGEVDVASIAGQGSTFTVRLPTKAAAALAGRPPADHEAEPGQARIQAAG